MVSIQREHLEIDYETGLIETVLSNGWIVKQRFNWFIDYDGVQVEYDPDAMEVIGSEQVEEYSAEERAALAECEWNITDLKTEISSSTYYREAATEFKASLNPHAYYGVSEKDFFGQV
ncbi:hypothetical protein GWP40_08390 [Treponema vincentii]|uniref:hypothetical protein n=1 Tax=Treponema vincentii TaxID=69710 RepID=UPI001BB01163|nr:hypothetical protein [Treponema vincentii]QUY18326.1 hypothetical protein GWP40_08390 [Treponema vincentii]